jgi:hypothetical protein
MNALSASLAATAPAVTLRMQRSGNWSGDSQAAEGVPCEAATIGKPG